MNESSFVAKVIKPQPGPQEMFLSSPADIVIYGGGAGGGKTWGLLLEPLRHVHNKDFGAVFFRRNMKQVKNEGGLWDESKKLYIPLGAKPMESTAEWKFSSGANISFAHLEYENNKFDWQGSQIALLCFDELTHFTAGQFWYMLSRNRSMCGVQPYVRCTTNPDPDSWVAGLISWWINPDTGYPIKERAGIVRYFVRVGETLMWGDSPEELAQYQMQDEAGAWVPIPPKSLTFIPSLLTDNKALMAADPGYMASLLAQPSIEQERLLRGNWKVKRSGQLFKRGWFTPVDIAPRMVKVIRAWDLAATEVDKEGDMTTAATASVKMGLTSDGDVIILHATSDRLGPEGVMRTIKNTAAQDGKSVVGSIPQDPGQAGKAQVKFMLKQLGGYRYYASVESGDKVTRAMPLAAQAEAGNVYILRGDWNEAFLAEMEAFPGSAIKDQVDAASRAFGELTTTVKSRFELVL